MRATRMVGLLCAVICSSVLLVAPASAGPGDPGAPTNPSPREPASVQIPLCSISFCHWRSPGFTGASATMPSRPNGTCYSLPILTRSYANNTSIQGYFYEGSGCSGRARAVTPGSQSRDLGFIALTFRYACVTC